MRRRERRSEPVLVRELYPERDGVIREFCRIVQRGLEPKLTVVIGFDTAVRQIASNKAKRLGVEGDDLEDVTSATMESVWGDIISRSFVPREGIPAAAYISKKAGWTSINLNKRRGVRQRRGEIGPEPEKAILMEKNGGVIRRPVEESVEKKLLMRKVEETLATLPPQQLAAVMAEINGNKIKGRIHDNRLFRARQQMRRCLKDWR